MKRRGLWESIANLDARLRAMLAAALEAGGAAEQEALRGLAAGPPVKARGSKAGGRIAAAEFSRLAEISRRYGLSAFETDALLVALAPEVDPRFGRLYAYLQDDAARRQPSVQLILDILLSDPEEKLERRACFTGVGALVSKRFVRVAEDSPYLSGRSLEIDCQVANYLLENDGLDARLLPFCALLEPKEGARDAALEGLPELLARVSRERSPLAVYFQGSDAPGRQRAAASLASTVNAPLLAVDLEKAAREADFAELLELVRRESWMRDSIRYFAGLDAIRDTPQLAALRESLTDPEGVVLLGGSSEWTPGGPAGVLTVNTGDGSGARKSAWEAALSRRKMRVPESAIDSLARVFRLTGAQIEDAVATARHRALWKRLSGKDAARELFAAARRQTGHEMTALARRIEPSYGWDDLILPADAENQLRELCRRVTNRARVLSDWGFGARHSLGKGVNALFAGGSGTGKTMAAEVIATELGLNLYKIDLASVVSKYIGETEKNLDRIFTAAGTADAVLFFDEADALFGKRSEIRDSHDRYANLEISYLLQKMEEYAGIAILATNLKQNMDEAFVRRLAFTVTFPFPDAASRAQIWRRVCPEALPLADDVDFEALAAQFPLTGGNIRNIALAAAFEAAAENAAAVAARHILHAARREYQKLGKPLIDADLEGLSEPAGRVA